MLALFKGLVATILILMCILIFFALYIGVRLGWVWIKEKYRWS